MLYNLMQLRSKSPWVKNSSPRNKQQHVNGLPLSYYLHSLERLASQSVNPSVLCLQDFLKKTFETKSWKTQCWVSSLNEMNTPEIEFSKWNCHFSMIVFVCSQDRSKNELALSVHIANLRDTRIIKVIMIS